jgi:hypothetical protein
MRREISSGVYVLRVYCDLCTKEGRPKPGRFGDVAIMAWGPQTRRGVWYAQNPRGDVRRKVGKWAFVTLSDPLDPDFELPPAWLRAYCRHHGWRYVAMEELIPHLGRSRTCVLTSRADPL